MSKKNRNRKSIKTLIKLQKENDNNVNNKFKLKNKIYLSLFN